jgi:uncharacterized protein
MTIVPGGRDERIDALRGFALLGILLVNIQSYVWGGANPAGFLLETSGTADRVVFFATVAFVNLKFMPLFALLFGASFALQLDKLRAMTDAPHAAFRRRMAFLFVFGVLHGVLLYFGDITHIYAVAGMLLLLYARHTAAALARVLAVWWAGAIGLTALLAWGVGEVAPSPAELAEELQANFAVMTGEGYLGQLTTRVALFLEIALANVVGLPLVVALMLTGMLAQRAGWLADRRSRAWRGALAVGLLVGLPASLAYGWLQYAEADAYGLGAYSATAVFPGVLGAALAFAYAALFITRAPSWLVRWLAPAGRMPLTNYLLQSVAMGALLSGWGLALALRLGYAETALLAVVAFAAQLVLSRWWLGRHAQGPVERVWRLWTYRGIAARPALRSGV